MSSGACTKTKEAHSALPALWPRVGISWPARLASSRHRIDRDMDKQNERAGPMTRQKRNLWIVALFLAATAALSAWNLWHADLHPTLQANGICFLCESPAADIPGGGPCLADPVIPEFGPVVAEPCENDYSEPVHRARKSRAPPVAVSLAHNAHEDHLQFETGIWRINRWRRISAAERKAFASA